MILVNHINKESQLIKFCNECASRGYYNNSSLKLLRYEFVKQIGQWWGAWYNNELIAIAGAHPIPELGNEFMRVLFRGCQLYNPYKGISKYHLNTVMFRDILSHQMDYYPAYRLIMTTNIHNDTSGKMKRSHKMLQKMSQTGIVSHHCDMLYYNTEQSLWEIDRDVYDKIYKRS